MFTPRPAQSADHHPAFRPDYPTAADRSRKRAARRDGIDDFRHLTGADDAPYPRKERRMANSDHIDNKVEDATAQIARLRAQVETLMKDRITPAVSDAAGRIESTMHDAADTVRGQAAALSSQVREQPLIAVLVAAGVGYVLGRIMR